MTIAQPAPAEAFSRPSFLSLICASFASVRPTFLLNCTWITGMETVKWWARAAYGCLVSSQSLWVGGLQPIDCPPALSVTQKHRCSCGVWLVVLCKCYMPLPFAFYFASRTIWYVAQWFQFPLMRNSVGCFVDRICQITVLSIWMWR